jgi:hypothetical protein
MNLRLFIDWQLQPVQLFLRDVPAFLLDTRAKLPNPDLPLDEYPAQSGAHLYSAAHSISLNAALYEINAAVDFILLAIGGRVLSDEERLTMSALSRSRHRLIADIEQHYGLVLQNLPGWHYVDLVRTEANALKHRGGMSIPEHQQGMPTFDKVDLAKEDIEIRLRNIRLWLYALSDSVSEKEAQSGFA